MTTKIKYPRTPHLPFSPGISEDDIVMENIEHFLKTVGELVITEKMDGECTTMYSDGLHARSIDSKDHPSRSMVKQIHGEIAHLIPEGWRICGENLYAKHSIHYTDLFSYFTVFSIYNDQNVCLSWNETEDWCSLLGLKTVPVISSYFWRDIKELAEYIQDIYEGIQGREVEGFVVRSWDAFHFNDFQKNVAKWVRKGHVQTSEHWMNQALVPNKIGESKFRVENPPYLKPFLTKKGF